MLAYVHRFDKLGNASEFSPHLIKPRELLTTAKIYLKQLEFPSFRIYNELRAVYKWLAHCDGLISQWESNQRHIRVDDVIWLVNNYVEFDIGDVLVEVP